MIFLKFRGKSTPEYLTWNRRSLCVASLTILKGYEEASKVLFKINWNCKLLSVCTSGEQLGKPGLILSSYPSICLFWVYNNTFGTNKAIQLRTPASQPPCCRLGWSGLYLTSRPSFISFYYGVENPLKLLNMHVRALAYLEYVISILDDHRHQ